MKRFTSKTHLFLPLLLLLSSCKFINWIDSESSHAPDLSGAKSISVVFSGNINGETHPCGCRHFPLGGLPQVAGALHDISKERPVLYVDAGDTFFVSAKVPDSLSSSLSYNAKKLAGALKELGLTYMVPGDQDFARGQDFLADIQKESKIEFLIANLKSGSKLNSRKWMQYSGGGHKLFLTGIVYPDVIIGDERSLFSDPMSAFKEVLKEMKEAGYDPDSPKQRLMVISHSGIDYDKKFASAYPMIDWIIGAHSQSFNKDSFVVGKTNLVQVLSRNHYLGEIILSLEGEKKDDRYHLVEMREQRADSLKPNPWFSFIDNHKQEMSKLQDEEQRKFFGLTDHSKEKYRTASSCIECHTPQAQKWQSTPHALAYHTLLWAGEENNLECLQCHTLGTSDPRGYMKASDVTVFEDKKKDRSAYLAEVKKALGPIESVRALKATRIRELSSKWMQVDADFGVSHNFANVQCLNCHDQAGDHPFDVGGAEISKEAKLENIKSKCLNCHDPDQSPEWYQSDTSGKVSGPNHTEINKHIKEIGCPAI